MSISRVFQFFFEYLWIWRVRKTFLKMTLHSKIVCEWENKILKVESSDPAVRNELATFATSVWRPFSKILTLSACVNYFYFIFPSWKPRRPSTMYLDWVPFLSTGRLKLTTHFDVGPSRVRFEFRPIPIDPVGQRCWERWLKNVYTTSFRLAIPLNSVVRWWLYGQPAPT